MTRKLSSTDWLLIIFTLMLTISTIGLLVMIDYVGSSNIIFASKLSGKPDSYFVLNNPDKYILEAITDGHSSFLKSPDLKQFRELYHENLSKVGSINIEYNGSYYRIGLASANVTTIPTLGLIAIFSLHGLVITIILKVTQNIIRKHYGKSKDFSSIGNSCMILSLSTVGFCLK